MPSPHLTLTTLLDVTALAIKKHIQKLREKAEKGDVDPTSATVADGTTPKSTPKKGPKTPTKAAGTKTPASATKSPATKSPAKKGTKRNADGDANGSGESQYSKDEEEKGLKVEQMGTGKRIKLENGKFLVDDGAED